MAYHSVELNTMSGGAQVAVVSTANGNMQVMKLASGVSASNVLIMGDSVGNLLVNLSSMNGAVKFTIANGQVTANNVVLPNITIGAGSVTVSNLSSIDISSVNTALGNVTVSNGNISVNNAVLPNITIGAGSVTVSNLGAVDISSINTALASVTVANGNISVNNAVLPNITIGAGSVTVSNLSAVDISSINTALASVTIANGNVSVNNIVLPNLTIGAGSITVSNLDNQTVTNIQGGVSTTGVNILGTYTSAQTNAVLYAGPSSSTTALHITHIKFSSQTPGNYQLTEGKTSTTVWGYTFIASNGGENATLIRPIVLVTGSALVITSTPATSHTCQIIGYLE